MPTKIEWATETWNPVVGCSKCSPGCKNCYALRMARRLAKIGHSAGLYRQVVDGAGWTGKIGIAADRMDTPQHWHKPRMIFVCSMGDLFHERAPYSSLDWVFSQARLCPQHTFLILTKRPAIMRRQVFTRSIPKNVWCGVTVCNQKEAEKKLPILLHVPAAVRFVSIEPMLGPIDLTVAANGLDWVICGGESGPGARSMQIEWVRGVRDQCQAAGVPFLFKQWGEWAPCYQKGIIQFPGEVTEYMESVLMYKAGKKYAGRHLDGRIWNQYPKVA